MILLNPIFDVHIREINSLKVSAFAATEKAKTHLRSFFKANDFVFSFNKPQLPELVKFCAKNKLKVHLDDSIRHRNKRSKD